MSEDYRVRFATDDEPMPEGGAWDEIMRLQREERDRAVDDAMMTEFTNGPAEPLDLDGLTVESMLAAQRVAHEAYRAKVNRDIFGPAPVFLAPGPSGDAVMAMRYALDMTRPRLDMLIGWDPGEVSKFTKVAFTVETDGTWRATGRRAGKTLAIGEIIRRLTANPFREKQRAARKVRMARKKRRGWA